VACRGTWSELRLLETSGPAVFSHGVVARKFCVHSLLLTVALMTFLARERGLTRRLHRRTFVYQT